MKLIQQSRRQKRGAALVEYGLIVAGVALVAAAAVSVFGHKTASMIGASAAILPGAQAQDNGTIAAGRIMDTVNTGGVITISPGNNNNLGNNLGLTQTQIDQLVKDPNGP
jgi:pilus assembly protein Flp/PilA